MRTTMIAWLLRWHMRIGAVVSVTIIAWGLSGMAHPILSLFNPRPAAMYLPLQDFDSADLLSPASALERAGLGATEVAALRLIQWQQPVYRAETAEGAFWLSARDASLIDNGEREYAVFLAQHFLGDHSSKVLSVQRQTHFDDEYVFINRLLPVWRVEFDRDDGARVYVDTASDRLGAIINDTKAMTTVFFRNVHSWVFIDNAVLRHALMLVFLAGGALVGAAGMVQYGLIRKRLNRQPAARKQLMRNWHRRIGIVVSLTVITFTLSGGWHLLQKHNRAETTAPKPWVFSAQSLQIDWSSISEGLVQAELVAVNGLPYFRVWWDGELSYLNASTGAVLANGEQLHALELAAAYAGESVDSFAAGVAGLRTVKDFGGEYGFINKRLPVIAVDRSDSANTSYYVEPRSGALAALVRNSDRAEGWSFAWLHKWHFLDGLGKTARDAIAALFAFAIALTFLLGLLLYGRRWAFLGKR